VVGLLGHAAHLWYTHARRQQRLALGLGGMLLLLGAAPLLHIILAQAFAGMGDAGGVIGRWLGVILLSYCNVGGALLISVIVAALGGMIVARPWLPVGCRGMLRLRALGSVWRSPPRGRRGDRRASTRRRRSRPSRPSPSVVVAPTLDGADTLAVTDALLSAGVPISSPLSPEPARRSPTEVPVVTSYRKPPLSLFNLPTPGKPHGNGGELVKQATLLAGKLHDFGVEGDVVQVRPGPVVTMYEFEPASGVKVSRIVNLADDLALGMKALAVRIVAPVPGTSVVGIEVPNPDRQPVYLRDIVVSPAFRQATSKLVLALGKDILGTPTVTDLAQIPHLLIAGATGSGKSVSLNSMICSLLLNATPE
jgi:S-DNA-T family DNA segregation ATPase FtsK/SpoIIIE